MASPVRKFAPTEPIGECDAPDSEIADGGRVSARITTAGDALTTASKTSCVYAKRKFGVGAKICIAESVHQCGSTGQWFKLDCKC
jgi:hypothetical protein